LIHLDSCFVIDLKRELREGREGPAHEALRRTADRRLTVSTFVLAELETGVALTGPGSDEAKFVEAITAGMAVVYPDERFALEYGRLAAYLRRTGQQVATMDLLIATSAIVEGAPLLTRDVESFSRVPGLDVLGY